MSLSHVAFRTGVMNTLKHYQCLSKKIEFYQLFVLLFVNNAVSEHYAF